MKKIQERGSLSHWPVGLYRPGKGIFCQALRKQTIPRRAGEKVGRNRSELDWGDRPQKEVPDVIGKDPLRQGKS